MYPELASNSFSGGILSLHVVAGTLGLQTFHSLLDNGKSFFFLIHVNVYVYGVPGVGSEANLGYHP